MRETTPGGDYPPHPKLHKTGIIPSVRVWAPQTLTPGIGLFRPKSALLSALERLPVRKNLFYDSSKSAGSYAQMLTICTAWKSPGVRCSLLSAWSQLAPLSFWPLSAFFFLPSVGSVRFPYKMGPPFGRPLPLALNKFRNRFFVIILAFAGGFMSEGSYSRFFVEKVFSILASKRPFSAF